MTYLSPLAVDVECQMAKFLAKTLRVCSGLVVLTYLGTEAVVAAVTGVVSFNPIHAKLNGMQSTSNPEINLLA